MKFILLASGVIAERFVFDERFSVELKKNLVGFIGTNSLINKISTSYLNSKNIPKVLIGEKIETEIKLNEMIDSLKPDYIISIQYPWILSIQTIKKIYNKVLNFHNAKIPDYRGHNTISHEILNNEKTHTCTLHWIAEEVDKGHIVKTNEIIINKYDTSYSLWNRSTDAALDLFKEWFDELSNSLVFPEGHKITSSGKYFSKNISSLKKVPENASEYIIEKWARAFWFPPHEPAYIQYNYNKVYVLPSTWKYVIPND